MDYLFHTFITTLISGSEDGNSTAVAAAAAAVFRVTARPHTFPLTRASLGHPPPYFLLVVVSSLLCFLFYMFLRKFRRTLINLPFFLNLSCDTLTTFYTTVYTFFILATSLYLSLSHTIYLSWYSLSLYPPPKHSKTPYPSYSNTTLSTFSLNVSRMLVMI